MVSSYQLRLGKHIEKEHYPTYRKLKIYHAKTGKCLSKEKFAESIATDHLKNEDSKYYTKLKKAGL